MLQHGALVDRYTVDSVIGTGGTAVVYRVRHAKLGTWHALKVLSVTSRSIRERMLREGRVQATLDHLNIVTVTDVLEVDGQPGLLMEYIEGPSLEKALEDYRLDVETAETLFLGIAAGVRLAHEHGLVHRDIKPANVLLAQTTAGFVPKVTDFGLAKVLVEEAKSKGAGQTRQGVAMGTPAYMAPEQIRDAKSVDVRADIWSMGCILYELCTGVRTFPGDDTLAIYNAVVGGDIVPPEEYNRALEPRFEMAIRGCLAIDRKERIPDCETLLAVMRGEQTWDAPELQGTVVEPTTELGGPFDAPALPLAARGPMGETPPMPPTRSRSPRSSQGGGVSAATQTALGEGGDPLFGPLPGQSVSGEPGPVAPPAMGTLTDATSEVEEELEPARRRSPIIYMLWAVAIAFVLFWAAMGTLVWYAVGPAARQTSEYESARDLSGELRPPLSPVAPAPEPDVEPEPVVEPIVEPEPVVASPSPAPRPRPRPSPSVGPPSPPPPLITPVPAEVGPVTVKLFSIPTTAFVTIDGTADGRTSYKGELLPGLHQVRLEVDGKVEEFPVHVRAEGTNKWCYVFETQQLHTGNCP